MLQKLLILLAASLLMAGCAGSGPKGGPSSGAGSPAWVLNPDKPGYQGVVGSAPKQDWGGREAQYRVALMKARQELAQMVRVQVESTTRSRVEERGGKVTRDADIETKLQSRVALSLEQAQVIEEWVDPQSGELYLWLVTPR
jgi:hypothetical protein